MCVFLRIYMATARFSATVLSPIHLGTMAIPIIQVLRYLTYQWVISLLLYCISATPRPLAFPMTLSLPQSPSYHWTCNDVCYASDTVVDIHNPTPVRHWVSRCRNDEIKLRFRRQKQYIHQQFPRTVAEQLVTVFIPLHCSV